MQVEAPSAGSPRQSSAHEQESSAGDDKEEEQPQDTSDRELLEYYRQRCEQFHSEQEEMLHKLAQIELSKEELCQAKMELEAKKEEVVKLSGSIKALQSELTQVKKKNVDLEAEKEEIQRQRDEDKSKIQSLLRMTQPFEDHIVCHRPQPILGNNQTSSTSFRIYRDYGYPSSLSLAADSAPINRKHTLPKRPCSSNSTFRSSFTKSKSVMNEYAHEVQVRQLQQQMQSIQNQLDSYKLLWKQREQTLMDSFADERSAAERSRSREKERLEFVEKELDRTQQLLDETTKDYLVLRHRAQENEKTAHEEIHSLQQQQQSMLEERKQESRFFESERSALVQSTQEEQRQGLERYKSQVQAKDRELQILTQQYAAVQEACRKRIEALQTRLKQLRSKYKSLEKRRALEKEGFERDVAQVRKKLEQVETEQLRQGLYRQEESYEDEIQSLKSRVAQMKLSLDS